MELFCCFVVSVISLVSATPYGYDTKGGVIAKADARAVSGTFGVPAALSYNAPIGGAFSGSFTKSSSTSFASSSASSSSSSNSFSYSGTGGDLNTFKTNNLSGSNSVAGSHSSSVSGVGVLSPTGPSESSGGISSSSGAISSNAALTGGHLSDETPCTNNECLNQGFDCLGANCNNFESNNKCNTGKCDSNNCESGKCTTDLSGLQFSGHDSNKECSSGECLLKSTVIDTATSSYNLNDIPVKKFLMQQSENNRQVSPEYKGPSRDCSNGACQSPTSWNLTPTNKGILPNSYQNPSSLHSSYPTKCDTPECKSGYSKSADVNHFSTGYNQPAKFLNPPSQGAICTTPNCQSNDFSNEPENIISGNKPHETQFIFGPSTPCSNGICGSPNPTGNIIPTANPYQSSSSTSCASGLCAGHSTDSAYSQPQIPSLNKVPGLTTSPGQPSFAHIDSTSGYNHPYSEIYKTGCNTPNCEPNFSASSNDFNSQGHSGVLHTQNEPNILPNNIPNLISNGQSLMPLGGDSDCTTSNCATQISLVPTSSYNTPSLTSLGQPPHITTTDCTTPNCATKSSTLHSKPNNIPSLTSTDVPYFEPSSTIPNCNTPNCVSKPSSVHTVVNNNPKITYPGLPPTPQATATDCSSSNCGTKSTSLPLTPNNTPVLASPGIPTFTPLGASPECSTLNCGSKPSYKPLSPNNIPNIVSPGLLPIMPYGTSTVCSTPDCASKSTVVPSTFQNIPNLTFANSPSFIPLGTTSDCSTPNCTPKGISTPPVNYKESSGAPLNCNSSNCASIYLNTSKQKLPTYTGGFGGPAGILKPNELYPSSVGFPDTTHALLDTNQKLPPYTGGFGGPTGPLNLPGIKHPEPEPMEPGSGSLLVNPSKDSLVPSFFGNMKPIISSKPLSEKYPSHTTSDSSVGKVESYKLGSSILSTDSDFKINNDIQKQNSNILAPSNPLENAQTPVDKFKETGNKNYNHENPPSYTGGFNAPVGLLKPNDYSFTTGSLNKQKLNTGNETSFNLPNHGHTNLLNNVQANAIAEAIAYTEGFGGPPGFLKPYDDGKLRGMLLGGQVTIGSHLIETHKNKDTIVHNDGINKYQDHSKTIQEGLATTESQLVTEGDSSYKNSLSQANAAAGASAGTFSGGYGGQNNYQNIFSGHKKDRKISGDCNGGCGSQNGSGGNDQTFTNTHTNALAHASATASAGAVFGSYDSSNTKKNHQVDRGNLKLNGGCGEGCDSGDGSSYKGISNLEYKGNPDYSSLSAVNTNAKSIADAQAFGGFGNSYSSSSASAQASSGYSTKGGYGKR